ncbi:hypothetical protein RZE82_00375 [Mollicutes bacterium LVI A0039]|nr:hypothetical protein RZE82_00375 [Mollicutes bacterium LVI A0039]
MKSSVPKIKYFCICFAGMTYSQNLFNSIKVLYFLSFVSNLASINIYKLFFSLTVFLVEVPTGYFADVLGNKYSVILSRITVIISMLFIILDPSFINFIIANILLGLSSSLDSGASNTLYMTTIGAEEWVEFLPEYLSLNKLMSAFLAILSSILYSINPILPFAATIAIMLISLIAMVPLQDNLRHKKLRSEHPKEKFVDKNKRLVQIILNSNILTLLFNITLLTSLLIFNFEYYSVYYAALNLNVEFLGLIYASFMVINLIGIQLFKRIKINLHILTGIVFISIILIQQSSISLFIVSVLIQQVFFAYINTLATDSILRSINAIEDSSHFQSLLSMLVFGIRNFLLLVLILLAYYFDLNIAFNLGMIIIIVFIILFNRLIKHYQRLAH